MFCASCNLHFPDHLSYCRRCGQSLASSAAEPPADSVCCTRCGARVPRGENFCNQCGQTQTAKPQETVVGACYHCGTSWRSGWLFCKTCGLDRDRALLRSTSSPALQATAPRAQAEELPEVEKVSCKRCGAAAKPFSRFCETCGNTLEPPKDAPITGKLKTPPAAASLRTQIDAVHPEGPAIARTNPQFDTQSEEPFPDALQNARTTQSDPPPPPPLIVRRLSPEGGPRKTVAISESGQTGRLSERTDRLTGGIDSAGPVRQARRRGRTGAAVSSVATSAAAATSSIRNASRRLSQRLAAQPVYQLPPREERRSSWPMIAMGMMVLLLATVVMWWLRKNPNAGFSAASDQPAIVVDTDVASGPSPSSSGEPAPVSSPPAPGTPAVTAPEGMVYVPGGTFEMGRAGGDDAETPVHKVTIKAFFIDRTEVTNEAYLRFVAATVRAVPSHWIDGKIPAGAERHPVVNVTWEDANAYAQWAGKRLPSEAEWELAARGIDGRLYPWGSNFSPAYANAGNTETGRIVEAGGYLSGASPYGALDMCGNVWEWTSSKLLSYQNRNEIAPGRVVRGGAFNANNTTSTATYRGVLQPDKAYPRTGFRCVRDVK